jgi:hypothetical protein
MRTPSLPKDWKIEERPSWLKYADGHTYIGATMVAVLLNPAGKIVTVFRPTYDNAYEQSEIDWTPEEQFLRHYSWECKPVGE